MIPVDSTGRRAALVSLFGALLYNVSALLAPAVAEIVVKADGTGDAPTIQAAINQAADGELILVEPGIYYENISLNGKPYTLRGTGGPENTIIDGGEGASSVIRADFFEVYSTLVEGFTVQNGIGYPVTEPHGEKSQERKGGGLICMSSAPRFRHCVFRDNVTNVGGGMYGIGSAPLFEDCVFEGNTAGRGAGAAFDACNGITFENCVMKDNNSVFATIHADIGSTGLFEDCTFANNLGSTGGIIRVYSSEVTLNRCLAFGNEAGEASIADLLDADLRIHNSTIVDNGKAFGDPYLIRLDFMSSFEMIQSIAAFNGGFKLIDCEDSEAAISCSNLFNPPVGGQICAEVSNNVYSDPLFCDWVGGNFTLRADSPSAPGNSPEGCGLIGARPVVCQPPAGGIRSVQAGRLGTRAGAARSITWGQVKARYGTR